MKKYIGKKVKIAYQDGDAVKAVYGKFIEYNKPFVIVEYFDYDKKRAINEDLIISIDLVDKMEKKKKKKNEQHNSFQNG